MDTTPQVGRQRSTLGRLLDEEGRRQVWLAERAGIDQADISRMCWGLQLPTHDQAARIARVLRRTPGQLGWPQHDTTEAAA